MMIFSIVHHKGSVIPKVVISLIAIFLFISPTYAQEEDTCSAGVYLTQDDFINNYLSHTINAEVKDQKLTFTFPADLTLTLKIVTPDSTIKFPPGSIYGYSECGSVYRYYPGGEELNVQEDFYKIEEAGKLIMWSSAFVSGNEIFYSMNLTAPIRRLTIRNLKVDFGNYPAFIDEAQKLNARLTERDENGFLVLQLYEQSVNSIN